MEEKEVMAGSGLIGFLLIVLSVTIFKSNAHTLLCGITAIATICILAIFFTSLFAYLYQDGKASKAHNTAS